MKRFKCILEDGVDMISGESTYVDSEVHINPKHVEALTPFSKGATVVRMISGTSVIVKEPIETVKEWIRGSNR